MDAIEILQKAVEEMNKKVELEMEKEYELYKHLFLKDYEYYGKVYTVTELKCRYVTPTTFQSNYKNETLSFTSKYKNIYTVILRHDFLEWKEVDANDLLDGKFTEVINYG